MALSVLSVASEAFPLVKTGGLADVAGALPAALAPHDVAVTTLLPGYRAVMKAIRRPRLVHSYDDLLGCEARLLGARHQGMELLILDAPELFARPGGPYADADGRDWIDNWRRFAALARAGADLASGTVPGFAFDILHAHDWQAALAPAYLRYAPGPGPVAKSIVTIHNIAFQGRYDALVFSALGLPDAAWQVEGVEYFGGVGFLKAGLALADMVTTVSPRYAREIRDARFGMGLEGLIAARGDKVTGIVNGIDPAIWSPASDPALAARFTARSLARRRANTRALERRFGLDRADSPLFIVVSRLTWQKGMDVLAECLDDMVAMGARLALLGSGDAGLETAFTAAATRHAGRIGVTIGYDEPLSHLMQGGGDAILVPSRFEPCGLTQLYALAYGCVPVVARTGGLADTVIHANVAALAAGVATGVQCEAVAPEPLLAAIGETMALHRDADAWRQLQRRGMAADFSWDASGRAYAALFRALAGA